MIENIGPTIYNGESIYNNGGGGGGGGGELPEEYIIGSCVDNPNGLGNSNGLITINTPVFYSQDFIEVSLFSTHNEQNGFGVCFEDKNSQPNNLFELFSKYNYYPSEMLAIIDGTAMSSRYFKNNLSKSYEIKYKIALWNNPRQSQKSIDCVCAGNDFCQFLGNCTLTGTVVA